MDSDKQRMHDFWDAASCGEDLYLKDRTREAYEAQARTRYTLEPYIVPFAGFDRYAGKDVLEIGVGLGADHQRFAAGGAVLTGIDLTQRAVEHTRTRLAAFGLTSRLQSADAENLPFADERFDLVYSWGVLHHSPDTPRAIREVRRVLRPGGSARIMIYHAHSVIGLMLWVRYGLLAMRPWTPLTEIYARHLESPGTKAYSVPQARELFNGFSSVEIDTVLTHGDLLESDAGQRHRGAMLSLARTIWPRHLIRTVFPRNGLFMLIKATR